MAGHRAVTRGSNRELGLEGYEEKVEQTDRQIAACVKSVAGELGDRTLASLSSLPLITFLGTLWFDSPESQGEQKPADVNSYLTASWNTEESRRVKSRAKGTDRIIQLVLC